jgi:hypothetical protein
MVLVDDAEWPLVVVNWPSGLLADEQLERALQLLATFYNRRHAVLHDGLSVTGMSAWQRRRLMQHSAQYEEVIRESVVASAAVIRSALWRGVIALIQRVAPTPSPFRMFGDRDEAHQWLVHALRRAGLWRPATGPGDPVGSVGRP